MARFNLGSFWKVEPWYFQGSHATKAWYKSTVQNTDSGTEAELTSVYGRCYIEMILTSLACKKLESPWLGTLGW